MWKLMETQIHKHRWHLKNIHKFSAIITQTVPHISLTTEAHHIIFTSREATTIKKTFTISEPVHDPAHREAGNVAEIIERRLWTEKTSQRKRTRRLAWIMRKWTQRLSRSSLTKVNAVERSVVSFPPQNEVKFLKYHFSAPISTNMWGMLCNENHRRSFFWTLFSFFLSCSRLSDEYTRITTPRQDVLFKKGYLSRMNNKTVTNLSATVNSVESTAASSTITTSDPDSSVSTLSPATTPSMDFAQTDLDYAPMYYPGYYDENGMLVIRKYPLYRRLTSNYWLWG